MIEYFKGILKRLFPEKNEPQVCSVEYDKEDKVVIFTHNPLTIVQRTNLISSLKEFLDDDAGRIIVIPSYIKSIVFLKKPAN